MNAQALRASLEGRYEVAESGCWLWTGKVNAGGYATAGDGGAHRRAYEAHWGPIPHGFHVDHICHNPSTWGSCTEVCLHRRCVNPEHLEVVTPRENFRRGRLGQHLPPDWA